jgi:hypothetical protein
MSDKGHLVLPGFSGRFKFSAEELVIWSLKRQQKDLTLVLHRPVEAAAKSGPERPF